MLRIENLYTGYTQDNYVLNGLSFEVNEGEAIALLGQNGSGKSTIAKAIINSLPMPKQKKDPSKVELFLKKESKGEIYYKRESIFELETKDIIDLGIGIFFQGGRVFDSLTGKENLALAYGKRLDPKYYNRITTLSEYIDLLDSSNVEKLNIRAGLLSGGERHKLALSMVLLNSPEFLILDEVSAGLDPTSAKDIYMILEVLKEREIKSFIVIEQNIKFAIDFTDRAFFLEDGKIVREEFTANLISQEKINKFNLGI